MEGSNIEPIISTETDKITNTFYVAFRSIDQTDLFLYGSAILITIVICRYLKLDLYISLAVISFIVLLYVSKRYVYNTVQKDHLLDQLNDIYPRPVNFGDYPDLIRLFYGLKRISQLNIKAYSEAIYNTDAVIQLYRDSKIGTINCKYTYNVAQDRAKDALNGLQSLIFSIETNKLVMQKFHDALKILNQILNAFLDKIKSICVKRTYDEGWNNESGVIPTGPSASEDLEYHKELGQLVPQKLLYQYDYY
jgi:hypothetical protein